MSLPENFAKAPREEFHNYFFNLCTQFTKVVNSSKSIDDLQDQMGQFITSSKEMDWQHHKDEGERATTRVWAEFKRYLFGLMAKEVKPNAQELILAIEEIQHLVDNFKAH